MAVRHFRSAKGQVTDVITSPPYLDTTNYFEDQWLRLWFLGHQASARYSRARAHDSRHGNKGSYWSFLAEVWAGVSDLLADEARIVVRIGGRRLTKGETRDELLASLSKGLKNSPELLDKGVTTDVKESQANTFLGSRASPIVEHDFCFLIRK